MQGKKFDRNSKKNFIRHIYLWRWWYFFKGFLLLLLPVYTKVFDPVEFGKLEIIVITSNLIALIMTMGLDSAQTMYFYDKKNGKLTIDRDRLISSILQFRIIWGLIIIGVSSFLIPFLLNILFASNFDLTTFFIAFFVNIFFIQTMYQSIEIFRLFLDQFFIWHLLYFIQF